MRATRGALALLGLGMVGLGLACATPPPARLRVEVLRGFEQALSESAAEARVEVLLDVTRSMRARTAAGPQRLVAARAAGARLARELPDGTALGLYALGATGGSCQAVRRVGYSEFGPPRGELAKRIDALESKGEGSLAAALLEIRKGLVEQKAADGARIVAITDLEDACGGDLCGAASSLIAAGVPLDLVIVGEAQPPGCLAELEPVRGADSAAIPAVRVLAPGADAALLARGVANGVALVVPAGRAAVEVDLDPPLRLERSFAPGAVVRLRVLDFPALDPPVREWRWEEAPGPAASQTDAEGHTEAALR
jgi:hypothetical protein